MGNLYDARKVKAYEAFYDMVQMQKEPDSFVKKLTEGRGMDK